MAQIIINNGDTGLVAREAINDNFTELYAGAFLPLAGGTLSGGLIGTTATFSNVTVGTVTITTGFIESTSGALYVGTSGAAALNFFASGSTAWVIQADGHFRPAADNTFDIGNSGFGHVRNIYAIGIDATTGTFSGGVSVGPVTFATLNASPATATLGLRRITDRGNKLAYPDGTNWRFVGDDAIIS